MQVRGRTRSRVMPGAVALAALLVAAACGGSDGGDETEGGSITTANQQLIEPTGEITPGGELIFAVEAETDGWDPTVNRWAVSGHQIGQAIFDTLATYNADGEAVPYLAESIEPNDDYTEWTITLREGITFHDGTPLDGAAIKANLERHLDSGLTAPAIRPIESVEVTGDLSAKVTMSEPWASFPVTLTAQVGYVVAPSQFLLDNPGAEPIGTGPFVFEQWTPDSVFRATRNPDYWRSDDVGNQLPYLDAIEFRPIVESPQRLQALRSGDVNLFHTTDPRTILDAREDADGKSAQVLEDGALGEESYVMLNMLTPPLDDLRIRQALAHATDRESYAEVIDQGIRPVAASPFIEASPWYSEEAVDAYPAFDPARATELVAEYEAEVGPAKITLGTTPSTANEEAIQFLQSMWEPVGIEVELKTTEQAVFIGDALAGNYSANLWRQLGSVDPDGDYIWWDKDNANDIGVASLNFPRIRSDVLNEALDRGRRGTTFEDRKAAYDDAQVEINTQIPYIWLDHTLWGLVADTDVRNIGSGTLPDGTERYGFAVGFPGSVSPTEIWLEQ